jgi:hypothetical protein
MTRMFVHLRITGFQWLTVPTASDEIVKAPPPTQQGSSGHPATNRSLFGTVRFTRNAPQTGRQTLVARMCVVPGKDAKRATGPPAAGGAKPPGACNLSNC